MDPTRGPDVVSARDRPFAETDTHWIALGLHRDLHQAFRTALQNTLAFLTRRAGLSRLDAYSLASLAASFRVTQVVDVNQGVHAMIPKAIFARELSDLSARRREPYADRLPNRRSVCAGLSIKAAPLRAWPFQLIAKIAFRPRLAIFVRASDREPKRRPDDQDLA